MLYQIFETQRSLMEPFADFAQAASKLYGQTNTPISQNPMAQRVSAGYDLLYRLGKDYEKPEFNIDQTQIGEQSVAIVEENTLLKPFCKLINFKKSAVTSKLETKIKQQRKVLIVAPLSGHHATLLRDTVKSLLPHYDVYITDWIDARMVPLSAGPFHLHDYIYYVQEFIRHLGPDLHVISVCQPTVPVLAAIALMASDNDPALPKTMTMMGGPIDATKSPTQVNTLATEKKYSWFENSVIYNVPANYPGFGRKVYPGFLQHTGFVAMNPDRHAQSHWDFYQHLVQGDDESAEQHRKFYNEYNAVLDLPAEYYLETIKTVFQEFRLPRGTWEVEGKLVKPQDIKTVALFTVEGELDDISGAGQTQAAHDLCSNIPDSMKQDFVAPGCGHYGIFSGRKWRELVCPKVIDFIEKHA